MRILVAGGAGFIGAWVCRALLRDGHQVICVDNFLTSSRTKIQDLLGNPRFTLTEADIADAPPVQCDLVLHLASPASPVHYKTLGIETLRANSAGTDRLLQIALDASARFVFVSTSEIYGDPLEHPQTESYFGNVDPIGPRACYDESKRFGEAMTMEYRRQHGVNVSIVRLFNVYGPGMELDDGRVIPAFIGAALQGQPMPLFGDGSQTRSFCYVDDLVRGLIEVALDWKADGEVFNIGNPEEISIRQLAGLVSELTGQDSSISRSDRMGGDPERRKPDISKMEAWFGWRPQVPLRTGLDYTIDHFRRSFVSK